MYGEAAAQRNPQALFNLGFMHEYGAGLPQDLHLAKRHYDKAMAAHRDAFGPVWLALASLWAHRAWLKMAPTFAPRWVGLWDMLFLRQEPTLGFGSGMGERSGLGVFLLMTRPVFRFTFGAHILRQIEPCQSLIPRGHIEFCCCCCCTAICCLEVLCTPARSCAPQQRTHALQLA